MLSNEELERRYTYHAPDEETRELHGFLRRQERRWAEVINNLPGESRELSAALTKLEEAMFWAHAHIARNLHTEEI